MRHQARKLHGQSGQSLKNGNEQRWSEEKWVEAILNAQPSSENAMKSKMEPKIHEINPALIKQIQSYSSKTKRLGHSEDIAGSFLMSVFHDEARKRSKPVDRSIWNLDHWRYEKRCQHQKQSNNKSSVVIVPVLVLPQQKKKAVGKKHSYLFSNQTQQQNAVIQDPFEESPDTGRSALNKSPTSTSVQLDDGKNIKYFMLDQVYQQLNRYAQGKVGKTSLQNLVSLFRDYTDEDLDFVTKVFEAFSQYSNGGDIYYPPTSPDSGMLLPFDDDQVIGILGDWGTGQRDAIDLLDELVHSHHATIVLHLGDVYYAGFPEEFQRISSKINQIQKEIPNFRYYTIPGNHDYYTFGGPYYDHLSMNHSKKEYIQQFGFFCLRNKSNTVQFIGLNTGKSQHGLLNAADLFFQGTYIQKPELQWAINKIKEFPNKTILLTHHQLFSAFEGILGSLTDIGSQHPEVNPLLAGQFFQVLPKLTCWMWGHQHRFSTYKQNSFGVNRSILAGNSSFQNNEQNYYEVIFPSDGIVDTKYHPAKGELGYYHHTGIAMYDFLSPSIKAKYVYMTSSFDLPSQPVKILTDTISAPVQTDIQYKKTYQLLEQSGLSVCLTTQGEISLSSQPANIQIINPNDLNATGKILQGQDVLMKIEGTPHYLCYSFYGRISQGNYEKEWAMQKHKYLWRLGKKNSTLKTGDIFDLFSVSRKESMGRQISLGSIKLTSSETPSRFFLYQRETTADDKVQGKCCCNVM